MKKMTAYIVSFLVASVAAILNGINKNTTIMNADTTTFVIFWFFLYYFLHNKKNEEE